MGSLPAHRTFRVNLITVWDHWVVEIPDAGGVHAMISDIGDAESVAVQAIATVLDVDPAQIRVVLPTDQRVTSPRSGTRAASMTP